MDENQKNLETPLHEGHRDRLRRRYLKEGAEGLSEVDLLELFLFFVIPRSNTSEIAHRLLQQFGSLAAIFDVPSCELERVPGVGHKTAIFLNHMAEIFQGYYRVALQNPLDTTAKLNEYIFSRFLGYDNEWILLILLTANNRIYYCRKIGDGAFRIENLDVRKIASICADFHCHRIVIAHNHPDGYALPSRDDIETTQMLLRILRSIDVEMIDHIIVSNSEYVSLSESGIMEKLELQHPFWK